MIRKPEKTAGRTQCPGIYKLRELSAKKIQVMQILPDTEWPMQARLEKNTLVLY